MENSGLDFDFKPPTQDEFDHLVGWLGVLNALSVKPDIELANVRRNIRKWKIGKMLGMKPSPDYFQKFLKSWLDSGSDD